MIDSHGKQKISSILVKMEQSDAAISISFVEKLLNFVGRTCRTDFERSGRSSEIVTPERNRKNQKYDMSRSKVDNSRIRGSCRHFTWLSIFDCECSLGNKKSNLKLGAAFTHN